ncbi:NADPH:quinone reductase [Streptomyces formicae]|uniref:Bifunctional protein: zinc-containing alcohol dehydrogenase, quinone oxidoreductase (NADPH:quinone reductase), Similar to arginate lyase n=1 Tax=Streptomyces formicae TaxID=1616117 RepID=A0A291QLE4_9ACTN|nr:NADPH:quinone reductase [Streptomyces formicae]ATL32336.1 Bifunctional protein: zinc-containing alcohol dehydrogenase, quinone oxidoreductase (NADPH:quinone reductase), Similar to arginate lyase [Streptomyces formicae]
MKSVIRTTAGGPEVLRLVERPVPEPGPGEVRVRVHVSGVNPTDWRSRRRALPQGMDEQVPHQDGAGVIDAVGPQVDPARVGQRVWLWEAAWERPWGTAQQYTLVPDRQAVALPDHAPFELGASLGIPALTAHRALTVHDGGPGRIAPDSLRGVTVLVAGGAGAVGNAAIQLARWAGARVVTTVSGPAKAALARAAGAHEAVDYRTRDAAAEILACAPEGVDIVVEVAPGANAALDIAVAAPGAVVAYYSGGEGEQLSVPVLSSLSANLRWQSVFVYTVPPVAKQHAVADVAAAVEAGALRVGEEAGLPLHRFTLARTADAHTALEQGLVGKVLLDVP